MTSIVGKHDVTNRGEAITKLLELTRFTPDEASAALDFIVEQFTDNQKDVNWSFALDVTLWVYEPRLVTAPQSASYGDFAIYDEGAFYEAR